MKRSPRIKNEPTFDKMVLKSEDVAGVPTVPWALKAGLTIHAELEMRGNWKNCAEPTRGITPPLTNSRLANMFVIIRSSITVIAVVPPCADMVHPRDIPMYDLQSPSQIGGA